ncbi:uncharacterized protein LOC110185070 isoform X1 [Drosophila serrata]|uniref:uncharacterized protein LOC110185070 isoform X1 n=1 Tax=Drosophila serrata TaxID=7274 RepID=UPI000A1CF614|nr:uncharacterized protein LOC110185070 isoform X1 [Drosophila serrata]
MDFREINRLNWRLHLNNNNNLVQYTAVNRYNDPDASGEQHGEELLLRQIDCATGATTRMGTKQKHPATTLVQAVDAEDDEGVCGGGCGIGIGAGDCAAAAIVATECGSDKNGGASYCDFEIDLAGGYGQAAAALSPTDAVGVGVGGLSSSRTSMNNSTENLSYASDNFYGDDLILLDDDDDVEAEEISLNSDDCVYAYRGDGADFDQALEANAMGRGRQHQQEIGLGPSSTGGAGCGGSLICGDDETEFLEMDFEPDPSSELEFAGGGAQNLGSALPQANLLLMQRDFSQMSGVVGATPTHGRQLYSSPIDDFPLQEDILQQQKQRLSKKFARISLNLDQIKDGGGSGGCGVHIDEIMGGGDEKVVDTITGGGPSSAQAHSLPSTLYASANFARSTSVPSAHPEPKLTGAKPKRLSHSSSVMSKSSASASTKSRRSHNSTSFDERCYSCTDFRAPGNQQLQQSVAAQPGAEEGAATMLMAAAAMVALASSPSSMAHFDTSNEENCLDCLEKEFLANTIGKVLDPSTCPKCRRRTGARGSCMSLYTRVEQTRCRSGSPVYFDEGGRLFAGWHSSSGVGNVPDLGGSNQRFISCDNNFSSGVQMLKKKFSTVPLVTRLSTDRTCDEEHLVQALDHLHVSYDQALLRGYFEHLVARRSAECSLNLKQLLLQTSKSQGNHRKLKKLIELATHNQLVVQFKRAKACQTDVVPVKVSDILEAWACKRDLSMLRQLDARFHRANVIGKVGHIVRQATAANPSTALGASSSSTFKRVLPEFLMIPQYYESGELTLTRKC